MDRAAEGNRGEEERVILNLLTSVDGGAQSQRRIAEELDIALGLVNAYLKRCVKKGYVKISQAPARRYVYYLTPKGFAEKSRLTVQFLSDSFSFFRLAKSDCASVFAQAKARGFSHLVLAGKSDLAEIAILCAVDAGIAIVAVVDPLSHSSRFVGVDVCNSYAEVNPKFDAVIITNLTGAKVSYDEAVAVCGANRVLAPMLLGLKERDQTAGSAQ